MTGLQKELQHCLARNRSKREEIEQLRSQINVVKKDAAHKEMERGRIEMVVKKQEVNIKLLSEKKTPTKVKLVVVTYRCRQIFGVVS